MGHDKTVMGTVVVAFIIWADYFYLRQAVSVLHDRGTTQYQDKILDKLLRIQGLNN
jgi:hypothetical protein